MFGMPGNYFLQVSWLKVLQHANVKDLEAIHHVEIQELRSCYNFRFLASIDKYFEIHACPILLCCFVAIARKPGNMLKIDSIRKAIKEE